MKFFNAMSNTRIISIIYNDNSNVADINTLHQQIKATNTNKILLFKYMIKTAVVTNHIFFIATTISKINSFVYINSVAKDCHQDNL